MSEKFDFSGDPDELLKSATQFLRATAVGRRGYDVFIVSNISVVEMDLPSRLVFTFQPSEDHVNAKGTIHGGFHATLIDVCSTILEGASHESHQVGVSVEISTQYISAAPPSHLLKIECELLKRGKRLIFTKNKVFGIHPETKEETLLAVASHTKYFSSSGEAASKL